MHQPHAGVSIGTLYHYVPNKDALLYALAERHLRQATVTLLETAARLRAEQPPLVETIRQLVAAVTRLHTAQPDLHRLLFDRAPRTAEGVERLRELERALAGEVEFQLRRLEVGGGDPALTALLLVQAVQAQIHGTVLDPPDGRTADECGRAIIDLWTRALTPPATPCRPAAESAGEGHR
ncbi:TetR/AcrR family transcriptional regulator [Nocardia sp. NPDC004085]